jgi:hypothetical protein
VERCRDATMSQNPKSSVALTQNMFTLVHTLMTVCGISICFFTIFFVDVGKHINTFFFFCSSGV